MRPDFILTYMSVKLYSFVFDLAGAKYGGTIPAESFEAAQRMIPFGNEWGELVEEIHQNVCSLCSGTIKRDLTQPLPVQDYVWADVIGD